MIPMAILKITRRLLSCANFKSSSWI